MREILQHTPLFALDAVAFDTETTGLDPRSARVIEMAAVTIRNGAVLDEAISRLVAPGVPVPAASTAVHGISDRDLEGAGPFSDVFPEIERFVSGRPVIGHTLGYDLAVLRRECALAGLKYPTWSTLDVRLLAEIAAPTLADFSLETLAAWLSIDVDARHRADTDAALTARVFLRLVPKLRDAGISTLGDAVAASNSLSHALDAYRGAGFIEPGADLPEAERLAPERRLDSYPYRHRVRDVMSAPAAFVSEDAPVRAALDRMVDARISSVIVGDPASPASALGIVTERDIMRALRNRGPEALDQKTAAVAARPLVTVPDEAFVYRAIGRMARHNIRHLAAVDTEGKVSGALSARDLLRLRASAAIVLGDDIDAAGDAPALARAWAKVPALAASLLDEAVGGRDIAAIIARELGALTRRVGEIAIKELAEAGRGSPPCAFALLILGSAGRGESLLALDQDHALIFASGDPGSLEDRWFQSFGERLAETLDKIGVPLCPGGVMASNAAFRGSLATWRQRIGRWIGQAAPEDMLSVDIFFDFRPVLGDGRLAAELWHDAWRAARAAPAFLRQLAEAGRPPEPPIGLFGALKTTDGRIDLKGFGLRPVVQSARLLALRHGVAVRSTAERLDGVRALGIGGEQDFTSGLDAHERFLSLVLRAQLADRAAGRRATNAVPLGVVKQHGGVAELKRDLKVAASLNQLALDQLSGTPG
jgi:DNA polymerase-3 subunit epsilon/CBS domain-containing protein